jgi:hypothetical protein
VAAGAVCDSPKIYLLQLPLTAAAFLTPEGIPNLAIAAKVGEVLLVGFQIDIYKRRGNGRRSVCHAAEVDLL